MPWIAHKPPEEGVVSLTASWALQFLKHRVAVSLYTSGMVAPIPPRAGRGAVLHADRDQPPPVHTSVTPARLSRPRSQSRCGRHATLPPRRDA